MTVWYDEQDGVAHGEVQSISEVLERLRRMTYSLEELQVRPTPEGVDPSKLESYLNDDDFQVISMSFWSNSNANNPT